ncbi:MAG: FHA domain-containing protein [Omnitrophica WOR_2 bacterium]
MNLNALLFAGKWAFIGLVYFILFVVVVAVRREMVARTARQVRVSRVAPGRLKVLNPGGDASFHPGDFIALKPETSLGAEADNDIILGDPFVSSHHALLRWDGAAWHIEDLGSTNGTMLNGRICPPQLPQTVAAGSRLNLGEMFFELMA